MKRLIINADDLGLGRGANDAILHAHQDGVVTSASLMANLPAFQHAVRHVVSACPELGLGIHLNLTCGQPILPADEVPLLVNSQGRFARGFVGLWRLTRSPRRRSAAMSQIAAELRAQFERVTTMLASLDCQPLDHVNGHQHVHMIPGVWELALELAEEFRAGTVRISSERLHAGSKTGWLARGNLLKRQWLARLARKNLEGVAAPGVESHLHREMNLVGVLDSGRLDEPTLLARLETLPDGDSEIVIHPSYGPRAELASDDKAERDDWNVLGRSDRRFQREAWRLREVEALCSDTVRARISELGINLTNFRQLNAEVRATSPSAALT